MEKLRLYEEQPKDRGTRKLAAKLALRGCALTRSQIHDPSKPYCDDPVPIAKRIKGGGYDALPLEVTMHRPCRRCAKCLQFRQMQWRERATVEINQAPRTWFITLTFSPTHLAGIMFEAANYKGSLATRIDRAAYSHVQKFLKRLRKTTRAEMRYLCVFERGEETGRAHYHVLLHEVSKPVTKSAIESQWRSHVHCRLVALGGGTAAYITKYATKSFDVKPRASVGYGKPKKPTPEKNGSSGT